MSEYCKRLEFFMKRLFLQSCLLAGFAVVLAGASAPAPTPAPMQETAAVGILPHRAYYKLTLDSARNDSEVKAAEGVMVFEWQDACDGWIVQQQMDVSFTHEEGEGAHLTSNYTTWEAKDGLNYTFNYRSTVNDNAYENFRGKATLTALGGSGSATFTLPEDREIKLPVGTMFPTAHTLALIGAAQQKKPLLTATVFDGTDAEGMSEISAVIGAEQPIKVELAKEGLTGPAMAWPLRMAFFELDSQEGVPEYEMDTTMLANGVSEFMLIDYGKFRLRGTLEKVELLPKSGC
jgi:hypothetical protein